MTDSLGMHWRQLARGGVKWNEAPIESQAVIIEAFDEVVGDSEAIREC